MRLEGTPMSVETDTRDKVIRVEVELMALNKRFDHFAEKHDAFAEKMDTVVTMVAQARGIGWFGLTMIPVAGAVGSFLTWLAARLGLHVS